MNRTKEFVKNYLIERGADLTENNWQDFDLIASGVIDSFEALSFVLVVNSEFGTHIKPQELTLKGLNKLGNLVDYLETEGARAHVS